MIPFYYKSLELMINAKIKLDPSIYEKLSELDETRVNIIFTDGMPSFGLSIRHHGVVVRTPFDEADVSLKAAVPTYAKMAMTRDIEEGLHISGDASRGRQVQQLLTELDLDWTGKLAEYIGMDAATCVSKGLDRLCAIKTSICDGVQRNVFDYVSNEDACVVSTDEVKAWSEEVNSLQRAVADLEQRIDAN